MKNAYILVFAFLISISLSSAFGAPSVSDLAVTDSGTGNVTVAATVAWSFMGITELQLETTNGLLRRYFIPGDPESARENIILWNNSDWNPYFQGDFLVKVTQYDIGMGGVDKTTATTNHTITRAIGGEVLDVEYFANETYSITSDDWSSVNTDNVKLHSTGLMDDDGIAALGCNLLNATVDPSSGGMDDDTDWSLLFDDTGDFYPAGTYFAFTTRLHQRPVGIMGMGNMVKYQWMPDDMNNKAGSGVLLVHISSCSPWRSDGERPISAHVGFAPLFVTDEEEEKEEEEEEMSGILMCTSAHYLDVQPVDEESPDSTGGDRIGLKVDGHAGTNSFLKIFIPDSVIESEWGITNPVSQLAGYADGTPVDTDSLILTRIEGGSTNIIYDWDGDGLNDAGYLAEFTFEFPDEGAGLKEADFSNSAVAEFGKAAERAPASPVYRFYSTGAPESTYTHLWTISEAERDVVSTYPSWSYEGIAWYANTETQAGSTPLYRLYEPNIKRHLYTINPGEYVSLTNTSWNGEGIAYYVYATNTVSGLLPAYRFYHSANQNHHYTIDENEKNTIIATPEWGYNFEGVGFYVFQTNTVQSVAARSDLKLKKNIVFPKNPVNQHEAQVWQIEGDYTGDGFVDTAFYNETSGTWSVYSYDGSAIVEDEKWGANGLLPVAGDFDGDGANDLAVYDPGTGEVWARTIFGKIIDID